MACRIQASVVRPAASGTVYTNERHSAMPLVTCKLCIAGAELTFRRYPGVGHSDIVAASEADVLAWMTAVRNGTVPLSTCAR